MKNNKRLKIGIFMDSYYPAIDGVVVVIDNLAKELSKYNDVTVVVPYTETIKTDKKRDYDIIRIRSIKVPFSEYRLGEFKFASSKAYKKLIKKDFDIIHLHSPFTIGYLGLRVAKDLNIPCVITMHTRFNYEIKKVIDNDMFVNYLMSNIITVYNKCDAAIAINKAMVKVFKDYGYKYKPTIIYNGTELLPLENKEEQIIKTKKKYNIKEDEIVFSFVGRITDIKNMFFILDSLKLLKDDNIKFKMIYVGTGPDEKKLKQRIEEYNLKKEIIMTGRIEDRTLLSNIYAMSDLFLFPSLFDASSLVQIEAAINETPGLFIKGSVTADTIINNVNGFTSKEDPVKYKERIIEIINNKPLLKKVSRNARLMLGKSWKNIAKETYNFYLKQIEIKKEKSISK
jgi:glycosyltransferase involved in cell wall biosynthesis